MTEYYDAEESPHFIYVCHNKYKTNHLLRLREAFPLIKFTNKSHDLLTLRESDTEQLKTKLKNTGVHEVYFVNVRTNPVRGENNFWHGILRHNAITDFILYTIFGSVPFYGHFNQLGQFTLETDILDAFNNVYYKQIIPGENTPDECGICYEPLTEINPRYHTCPGCSAKYCIQCVGNLEAQYVISLLNVNAYGVYSYQRPISTNRGSAVQTIITEGLLHEAGPGLKCSYCRTHTISGFLGQLCIDGLRNINDKVNSFSGDSSEVEIISGVKMSATHKIHATRAYVNADGTGGGLFESVKLTVSFKEFSELCY